MEITSATIFSLDIRSSTLYDFSGSAQYPEDRKAYHEGVEAIFAGKRAGHDMQYRAKRPNGDYDICTCRGLVICDEYGAPEYFGGAIRNHSQQSQVDSLTGLRNQFGFYSDLQKYIRNKTSIQVGMVGIGKLTEINEVYGYDIGNKILQRFGRYLMERLSNRGGAYRLDGACFGVISTLQTQEGIKREYEGIRELFRKGIKIDDLEISLELNAGLLSLDDFNVDDQTVYSCLNFAYEESKISKHGDIVVFHNELTTQSRRRLEKLHVIRAAINKDYKGFYLVYQPVVDAKTEKLIGVEALLRWKDDDYGIVPPDDFIPFIETDPLFPKLGAWILETAINDARKLIEFVPNLKVNVNLSYSQLEKTDFADVVRSIISDTGITPSQVCLEVTERCKLLDMDLLRNVIVTLRAGGVRFALDDFGTGFSSLGLVKNLPFDTIKIDRSFVQQIEEDEREKRLLNNFTDIAGTFGAEVCVEGIETTGMRDIIKDYSIHSFQGYYYSKPVDIESLLEMVKNGEDCFAKQ